MKKYTAQVLKPCPFHSASQQAKNWKETHEMKIVVSEDKVFTKTPSAPKGGSSCVSMSGSKWKQVSACVFRYKTIEQFLLDCGAVESNFRGAPKGA